MEVTWKNSMIEPLPADKTKVFIMLKGVYHPAQFDAGDAHFLVEFGNLQVAIPASTPQLYWTESE